MLPSSSSSPNVVAAKAPVSKAEAPQVPEQQPSPLVHLNAGTPSNVASAAEVSAASGNNGGGSTQSDGSGFGGLTRTDLPALAMLTAVVVVGSAAAFLVSSQRGPAQGEGGGVLPPSPMAPPNLPPPSPAPAYPPPPAPPAPPARPSLLAGLAVLASDSGLAVLGSNSEGPIGLRQVVAALLLITACLGLSRIAWAGSSEKTIGRVACSERGAGDTQAMHGARQTVTGIGECKTMSVGRSTTDAYESTTDAPAAARSRGAMPGRRGGAEKQEEEEKEEGRAYGQDEDRHHERSGLEHARQCVTSARDESRRSGRSHAAAAHGCNGGKARPKTGGAARPSQARGARQTGQTGQSARRKPRGTDRQEMDRAAHGASSPNRHPITAQREPNQKAGDDASSAWSEDGRDFDMAEDLTPPPTSQPRSLAHLASARQAQSYCPSLPPQCLLAAPPWHGADRRWEAFQKTRFPVSSEGAGGTTPGRPTTTTPRRAPLYKPPPAVARKVMTATALIVRQSSSLDSPVIGRLPIGQFVFIADQQQQADGSVRALVSESPHAHIGHTQIGWVTISKEGRSLLRDDCAIPTIFGPDERFFTSFGTEAAVPLLAPILMHSPRAGDAECRSARLSARLYAPTPRNGSSTPGRREITTSTTSMMMEDGGTKQML